LFDDDQGSRFRPHVRRGTICGIGLLVFALLVWCAGMQTMPAHAAGGDPLKGKAVYEKNCLICHGSQGKGDGQFGQVTNPPAADFTSAVSKKQTDAQLLATIQNGRPPTAMEGWKGQLSNAEIHDVLAYVNSLRQ
jgi:mono/diheme cytochrome c family protein